MVLMFALFYVCPMCPLWYVHLLCCVCVFHVVFIVCCARCVYCLLCFALFWFYQCVYFVFPQSVHCMFSSMHLLFPMWLPFVCSGSFVFSMFLLYAFVLMRSHVCLCCCMLLDMSLFLIGRRECIVCVDVLFVWNCWFDVCSVLCVSMRPLCLLVPIVVLLSMSVVFEFN